MSVVPFPGRARRVTSYAVGLSGSMLQLVEGYTAHLVTIGAAAATVRARRDVAARLTRTYGDVRAVTT